jgi:hypothetical protein
MFAQLLCVIVMCFFTLIIFWSGVLPPVLKVIRLNSMHQFYTDFWGGLVELLTHKSQYKHQENYNACGIL